MGDRTFQEVEELLRAALRDLVGADDDSWVWIRDVADDWVAYGVEGTDTDGTFKTDYSIDDDAKVTLGPPQKVQPRTEYEVIEAQQRVVGRVLEAKGTDAAGGRVFHVRIIEAGDSKNGRRYPIGVLSAAAHLYEGAKAFDHHRTMEEIDTSTIAGLVGHYRNVEADDTGLDADLHLLPGATHTAEALDASLGAQSDGGDPIVGISHDVIANWQVTTESTRRFQEATQIVRVLSADVVADPAAGGKAIRMVAGGSGAVESDPTPTSEEDTMPKSLSELLAEATDEDKAALRALLDGDASAADTTTTTTTEPAAEPAAEPADGDLVAAGAVERDSLTARGWIREAVAETGLTVEQVTDLLPEKVTESTVTGAIGQLRRFAEGLEKRGLVPRTTEGAVTVGEEHLDKAKERMYQTLCRNWQEGYNSYFDMFEDITGQRVRPDMDGANLIVRESWAQSRIAGTRLSESVSTGTFGEILGDSVARRLLDMYGTTRYGTWRQICRTATVRDFRTQRRDRMGGYGNLPDVAESGTYQPLTSPTDEEATYAVSKKGGTEDLTWESVMNDDLGALARIPESLGRAAARTLHEFVWLTLFASNPTCTYDTTALFAGGHSNTTAVALSNAGMNTLRQKMRDQAEYGVTGKPLGLTPKFLIVPNELEDLANQLTLSQRAVPATTPGASDVPNLHAGMTPIVVDEFTDADDWYLAADPIEVPTIEIGFLSGREEPELFMQDDPKAGAVFSSDKVTWKIRHVYSGANLDHRGFQRGTQ